MSENNQDIKKTQSVKNEKGIKKSTVKTEKNTGSKDYSLKITKSKPVNTTIIESNAVEPETTKSKPTKEQSKEK